MQADLNYGPRPPWQTLWRLHCSCDGDNPVVGIDHSSFGNGCSCGRQHEPSFSPKLSIVLHLLKTLFPTRLTVSQLCSFKIRSWVTLHKIRWSTDIEAHKLWGGGLGSPDSLFRIGSVLNLTLPYLFITFQWKQLRWIPKTKLIFLENWENGQWLNNVFFASSSFSICSCWYLIGSCHLVWASEYYRGWTDLKRFISSTNLS